MEKIIILKNDRIGDLFVSLNAINLILNKHKEKDIILFLSKLNYKFGFLFKNVKIKNFNFNLNIFEKINIFLFILFNNITDVYILAPKNFYYYLPFFFRNIKFHGICINSKKSRPSNFLRKYLYSKEIINRLDKKNNISSYLIQERLINYNQKTNNLIKTESFDSNKIKLPNNSTFFHYKKKLFSELLEWDFVKVKKFLEFLSTKKKYLIFSSEINNDDSDNFFYENFNSIDFKSLKYNKINEQNILFLKNIDGINLFNAIKGSIDIVAPEGIVTHIGYFLKKDILALMHFKLNNKEDFKNQLIACKEWFPPYNFKFTVLKKNYDTTIKKLNKRI